MTDADISSEVVGGSDRNVGAQAPATPGAKKRGHLQLRLGHFSREIWTSDRDAAQTISDRIRRGVVIADCTVIRGGAEIGLQADLVSVYVYELPASDPSLEQATRLGEIEPESPSVRLNLPTLLFGGFWTAAMASHDVDRHLTIGFASENGEKCFRVTRALLREVLLQEIERKVGVDGRVLPHVHPIVAELRKLQGTVEAKLRDWRRTFFLILFAFIALQVIDSLFRRWF